MKNDERQVGDGGLTLVELLVAMFVTGIMLAIVGGLFVNVARSSADARTARTGLGTGANAINEMRRVIRVATTNPTSTGTDPAIVAGSASSLTLYSYVDADPAHPAPTRVAFSVNTAGDLIEQRTAGTLSGGYWAFTGPATTQTLPGPIVTSGGPLFGFLDSSGAAVVPDGSTWAAAARATVHSVTVTTTVANTTRAGADPIQLTDTVNMPNLTSRTN